jgi:excisionase family DNA binding protein
MSQMLVVVWKRDGSLQVKRVSKGATWTRDVAPDGLLTVAECAAALNVTTMTVGRWISTGDIKSMSYRYGGRRVVAKTLRQYAVANGLFLGGHG